MKGGFTLMELLVVVSIITLLAALLMPAIALVRDQASAVGCMSNLRQYGLAHEGFAADHDGALPNSKIFHEELAPFLDLQSSFTTSGRRRPLECPAWRRSPYYRTLVANGDGLSLWILGSAIGYGAPVWYPRQNEPTGQPNWPDRVNFDVWNPSGPILVASLDHLTRQPLVADAYGYAIWNVITDPTTNFGDHERHGGKANVLFADHHAGRLDRVSLMTSIDAPWTMP